MVFDLEAICDFIFDDQNNRTVVTEIQQNFGIDGQDVLKQIDKRITETKKEDNHKADIKYEIVKTLLDTFSEIVDSEGGTANPMVDTLNQQITYNTLFSYGFIKDIEDEE